jgi:hypothetical protein
MMKNTFFNNLTHSNDPYKEQPNGNMTLHDYGRGGLAMNNNANHLPIANDYVKNLVGYTKPMNYVKPDLEVTKKQLALYDTLDSPMVQPSFERPMIYENITAPKETLRQSMIDGDFIRNLKGTINEQVPDIDVYVPNRTLKQDSYIENYIHNPMGEVKSRIRDSVEATTIHSNREELSKGRIVGAQGRNTMLSVDDTKTSLTRNIYKDEPRQDQGRFGYNTTQMASSGSFRDKDTLPNEPLSSRLDPRMLSALNSNPYAHSFVNAPF